MVRLRLDIAYEGTDFSGWARQPATTASTLQVACGEHEPQGERAPQGSSATAGLPCACAQPLQPAQLRTVQACVEDALQVILRLPEPPALTVAGRTDAGVHARGQVAHVDVPEQAISDLRPNLLRRLAGVLPPDVRVTQVSRAPAGFDARFAALARHYTYRLWVGQAGPDPLLRRFVLGVGAPLQVAAMAQASQGLLGEHDFAAYCKKRPANFTGLASTIRRLQRCEISVQLPDQSLLNADQLPHSLEQGLVQVQVSADAFCHSMVRSLVGALVVVGQGRREPGWPAQVLQARQRDSAVQVLPPTGLTLEQVDYPHDDQLVQRVEITRRYRGHDQPTGSDPG